MSESKSVCTRVFWFYVSCARTREANVCARALSLSFISLVRVCACGCVYLHITAFTSNQTKHAHTKADTRARVESTTRERTSGRFSLSAKTSRGSQRGL